MRKISVCIITKNESEKLKKCLKQLMGYGFEIIVVDTGSTDDTVVMAKKYADKVCYFSWCNDFSAARNYALTQASNDIVMMIDSDEYLQEIDTGELEKLLKNAEVVVEEEIDVNKINIGCKVKLLDVEYDEEMEFYIVGSTEANSLQNKISNEAPVGRALIGKSVGDVVDVETQAGIIQYKVLEIQRVS